ncbi:MAG: YhdP family protein, partial [Oceanococcaceae bacterium]
MSGLRRLLWLGLGLALIALAAATGFRMAMYYAPEYRELVAQKVGEALSAQVEIGGLALGWSGWAPALDMYALSYQQGDAEPLRAERLRVGFDPLALLQGELRPRRLILAGTELVAYPEGEQWTIRGLPPPKPSSPTDQDPLKGLRELRLRDVRLQVLAAPEAPAIGRWDITEARLSTLFGRRTLSLRASEAAGGQLDVELLLDGLQPQRISGSLRQFDWAPWMALLPEQPPGVPQGQVRRIEGTLERAEAGSGNAWSLALEVDARLQPALAEDGPSAYLDLQGPLRGSIGPSRLRLESPALRVATESGAWPEQALWAEYQSLEPAQLKLQAGWLELEALWPLLRPALPADLPLQQIEGALSDITLSWSPPDQWPKLLGRVSGLGFALGSPQMAVRGVDGEFSSDGPRGRLLINAEGLDLEWPKVFSDGVAFDSLGGTVDWAWSAQGLQFDLPDLAFGVSGVDGVGRVQRQADGSWYAESRFLAPDVTGARAQIPLFWHERLREWLAAAARAGELREGRLRLEGDSEKVQHTALDLDLSAVDFQFAPGWEPLIAESGALQIRDQDLRVQVPSGRLRGVQVRDVRAQLALSDGALLMIDADIEGEGSEILDILARSPIGNRIQPVRRSLDLRGKLKANLDLGIDLDSGGKRTTWAADAELNGASLRFRDWPSPLTGLRGRLNISGEGLQGEDLRGRMNGWPLRLRASRRAGRSTVRAEADAALNEIPANWPLPEWLRTRLGGRAEVVVEAAFGADDETEIRVRSDLVGATVALPPPFDKEADLARRLQVLVRPESQRLDLSYGQLFGLAAAELGRPGQRLSLRLGTETASLSPAEGLWIEGAVEKAELGDWFELIGAIAEEGGGGPGGAPVFGGANLRVGELRLGQQAWPEADLQLLRANESWLFNIAGPGAQGQLLASRRADGQLALAGQFERLDWLLDVGGGSASQPADDAAKGGLPESVPALDLRVSRFRLNRQELGPLTLALTSLEDGYQVDALRVGQDSAPDVQLEGRVRRAPVPPQASAGGANPTDAPLPELPEAWTQPEGPAGSFRFQINSESTAPWLRALGYADWLQARRIRADGELAWQSAADLDALRLDGAVDLRLDDGRLLSVNPGAGRLLGLLSVTALPRRFLLDFSDVTDTGLGFDSLEGAYTLEQGLATTEGLKISGPSVRIEASGQVDLVNRTQDQKVTVMPGISHGLTAAATVLGGPAMGLFLLFAQELLDKPLD